MKRILPILVILGLCCFWFTTAQALTINPPGATISSNGTAYNGTRLLDPVTKRILSETWAPNKPSRWWTFTVSITATGYGEVVLALFGGSTSEDIGDWRNGPKLRKADNEIISYSVETFSPAYNFPMLALDFNMVALSH